MKTILQLLVMSAYAVLPTSLQAQIPLAGLQGYYHLDGNGTDAGPNLFHGVLNGQTPDTGHCSTGLRFINNFIDCGDPPGNEYDIVNDATILLWFMLKNTPSSYYTLIGKDVSAGNNVKKWFVAVSGNQVSFHINGPGMGGGYWQSSAITSMPLHTFHHLAITKSGNNYAFYIDTVLSSNAAFTVNVPDVPAPLRIGKNENSAVDVVMDEVLLYNRVLSDAEIKQVYTACAPVQAMFYSSDTAFCGKKTVDFFDLSVNNPASWQWHFQGAIPDTSSLQNPAGIYYPTYGQYDVSLVACNLSGCDTLEMISFIQEYPDPQNSITAIGDTLYSLSFPSYQWFESGTGIINGATNQFYVAQTPGAYYCLVTDSNGCQTVSNIISVAGLAHEPWGLKGLRIYPNPCHEVLHLEAPLLKSIGWKIRLFSSTGMEVCINDLQFDGSEIRIQTSGLSSGLYFFWLADENNKTLITGKINRTGP